MKRLLFISLLLLLPFAANGKSKAERMGWKLAVQSWTFHKGDLCAAIDKTVELGLKYIEVFPGQTIGGQWGDKKFDYNLDAATCKQLRRYAAAKGVRIVGSGVFVPAKSDEWQREFEFAKRMKLEYITCEPALEDWDLVEQLAKKTGIKVSVHNHPKPSHYWSPTNLLQAIGKRSKLTGSCADVGHWLRCGLMPVECMRVMKGRMISMHFKDIVAGGDPEAMHDTVWGEGIIKMPAMLRELKAQKFRGYFAIEYEYNWDNSMPEIKKSIENFNRMVEELR